MSTDGLNDDFQDAKADKEVADHGPLGNLPRLNHRQVKLEERLARLSPDRGWPNVLSWLEDWIGTDVVADRPEILWRASGLRRSGMIAQLTWPSRSTRVGLSVETSIAHAVVDRLLGFKRLDAEGRLQLTPVEWGILTFVVARTLERLREQPGPWGAWELAIDRVGPDMFDLKDLGEVITIRWPLRIGSVTGSARLWVPGSLLARWIGTEPPSFPAPNPDTRQRLNDLVGVWRAEAGTVTMPRGLGKLRVGGVLPLIDSRLRGTPQSPSGPIELALPTVNGGGRYSFPAEPEPSSGGRRVKLTGTLNRSTTPRESVEVNLSTDPAANPGAGGASPMDAPVTLIIELGRVNLSLGRLADLKPGDVVELGRHSREPVELTSGGRLVARGELVQIDTELGVRVTNVFL